MDPTLILALAQSVLGGVQAIAGGSRAKRLLAQRTPYQTPDEYKKIAQALQNSVQGDPAALNYYNNQSDRAFNKTLGVAERIGANPNDLASIFDQKVNDAMKFGAEYHAENMNKIGKYLGALDVLGQNDAAEQKSREDLIKDQQQATSAEQQAGFQNILGGANTAVSSYANGQIKKLFTTPTATTPAAGYPNLGANVGRSTSNIATALNAALTGVSGGASAAAAGAGSFGADEGFLNAILELKNKGVDLSGIDFSQYL